MHFPAAGTPGSRSRLPVLLLIAVLSVSPLGGEESPEKHALTPEALEFFESRVRPVLVRRCHRCHSGEAEKIRGGLLLDSRAGLLAGGETGPVVRPGDPDGSRLIEALRYRSTDLEMPPDRKLPDREIEDLVRWVEMGAPWPGDDSPAARVEESAPDWKKLRAEHWAWQPVRTPPVPRNEGSTWPRNPVDHFVLRRLRENGLEPAGPAHPATLLRRLHLTLTGLPPTLEEVSGFESEFERNPELAVGKAIDRLLDSPRYGEHWGRHWLDVARYSDGHGGFLDNRALGQAWRYRDWVVEALERDVPIDDFVKLQIAGDLMDPGNGAVATGFLALGPTYQSDGGDPDSVAQARAETLDDRVDTLTRGLLGLTVSCARCHSHKFDPVPHSDYYSLAGVFHNTRVHDAPLVPGEVVQAFRESQEKIEKTRKQLGELRKKLDAQEPSARSPGEIQEREKLERELEELRQKAPAKYPTAHALMDTGSSDMRIALRGNPRKPGEVAPRRFLRILSEEEPAPFSRGSGRLELAEAIASPDNPLTARVFVNRVWQHHLGQGLVSTASNFGILGEKPSHPELLDWLAARFLEEGWSLKKLHRWILTSATFRQAATFHRRNFEIDGDNRLLWRFTPRRLPVESLRDALLLVTGELDFTRGGPPVENVHEPRRTLYFKVSRNGDRFQTDTFLRLFDFPLMRATVARRPTSIVPQQYLFLLNSEFMERRAAALIRVTEAVGAEPRGAVERIYRRVLRRQPDARELELALEFLGVKEAISGGGEVEASASSRVSESLWGQYARAILSSNEFLFVR